MLTVVYVVNPAASGARAPQFVPQLRAAAGALGLQGEIVCTDRPGDATVLAGQAAAAGAEVVVAVGGDGTAAEVAAGLLGTGTALAVLPAGSGNDLAAELGMPREWRHALAALVAARRRRIDVGFANGRPFLQSAGAGLDAYVAQLRQRGRHLARLAGPAAYATLAILGLLIYRPVEAALELDGRRWTQRLLAVTVANGERYGGGLRIAPGAQIDDGQFDVAIIGDLDRLDALRTFPRVYHGAHLGHPKFRLLRGRSLTVSAARPLPVHADGELHGVTPATFTIQSRALEVLCLR
jgi:diacylglycerol kinase (ATP)